jgi:phage tail-like protein
MADDDDVKVTTGEFFRLDLGGMEGDMKFKSCSLPSGSLTPAVVPFINGQSRSQTTSVAVTMNWTDIVITRAVDDKSGFWEWFKEGIPADGGGTGKMTKKDVNLELVDGEGNTVKKWALTGAHPTSFAGGGTLNAGSGEVMVETLTLGYDHCTITNS